MNNEEEDAQFDIDDFLKNVTDFGEHSENISAFNDIFSSVEPLTFPDSLVIPTDDFISAVEGSAAHESNQNPVRETAEGHDNTVLNSDNTSIGHFDDPFHGSIIDNFETNTLKQRDQAAEQAASPVPSGPDQNSRDRRNSSQDENSSLDLSVDSDDFKELEYGNEDAQNERTIHKQDTHQHGILGDDVDKHINQGVIRVTNLDQKPIARNEATLGRVIVNKIQRKRRMRKKKVGADDTIVLSHSDLSAVRIDKMAPLPPIEVTIAKTQGKDSLVECIQFEFFENDGQFTYLEKILSISRLVRQPSQDGSMGIFAVRDEDLFLVLYEMMKSRVLHRQEAFHAAFISHILQESIAVNTCGAFVRRYIKCIEAVTARSNVHQLAIAILPSPKDDGVFERALEAVNDCFREEVAEFHPSNYISLATSMIDDSKKNLREIQTRKKDLHGLGSEFRRMRRELDDKGAPYIYCRLPTRRDGFIKKETAFTVRRGELVNLIVWYLNEVFLCNDVHVHFVYGRMLVKAIIACSKEDFYADRVGQTGDFLKRLFYEHVVERMERLMRLIVQEMTNERDMRIQSFMSMIQSNFSQPDRSYILSFDETKVRDLVGISIGNPLVSDYGAWLGPLLVTKLESDIRHQKWTESFLDKREMNFESVKRAYDQYTTRVERF